MKKIIAISLFITAVSFTSYSQSFVSADAVVKVKTSAICKMCKKRIERDLSLTKGVSKAELNLDDKVVTVAYNANKTSPEEIRVAITKIGYDADTKIADQKAHDRLPDCCQKTAVAHKD